MSVKKEEFIYWIFLILISYPLLYYNYKFGNPNLGLKDFFDYYPMYLNWDFSQVESPFNTRILSISLVYLLVQTGFYYPTKISFENAAYDPELLQLVFFHANLVSYLGVVLTCYFLKRIMEDLTQDKLFASVLSVLYLLAFATKSLMLSGLTDSWGVLLGTIGFFLFLRRSIWIFPVLLIAIVQREYIFFIFGLIGLFYVVKMYLNDKKLDRYSLSVMFASIFCFILYFILRKTIFYTEQHADQLETAGYVYNLVNQRFPFWDYVFQSFFIQNILILYILVLMYKLWLKMEIDKMGFLLIMLLLLMVVCVSFIAVLGNSAGRYFHINIAVVFYFLAKELYPLYLTYVRKLSVTNG
ncbi:MAG: hypothetical protein ACXITV_00075 [Luteibaculaceae bacterium]